MLMLYCKLVVYFLLIVVSTSAVVCEMTLYMLSWLLLTPHTHSLSKLSWLTLMQAASWTTTQDGEIFYCSMSITTQTVGVVTERGLCVNLITFYYSLTYCVFNLDFKHDFSTNHFTIHSSIHPSIHSFVRSFIHWFTRWTVNRTFLWYWTAIMRYFDRNITVGVWCQHFFHW